ncbi:recombinase family protein [Zoogloea sp.]|uniref:recombinase family protein n=1 Tax=Zoogloea sp. TaxID=49181 RepID=UPI002627276E|nr:recombinase family protein [Zoogloea sp.]MDD3352905.1 recombinase family protein [Zoogloea sp.]
MSAIVAYARVSTDDQTCENQRRTISARYAVAKWFTDDGVSGAIAATERPSMAALLAYVREGDVVIVAAIDRLGRNTIDVLCTVEALKAKGVSVVSMREGFDLVPPAGKPLGRSKSLDDAAVGAGGALRHLGGECEAGLLEGKCKA